MVAYAFSTKQVDLQDLPGPMNFLVLAYWKKKMIMISILVV